MALQVNARLPDNVGSAFERWASELGLEKGALGRDVLTEAVQARREGRAMFERPEALGPGDMIALKAMVDRAVMEIDRIAVAWAKHEVELRKQERDDQRALTRARTEFIAGMPERISASLNPIRAEMTAMARRIEEQPRLDAIDDRQRDHTEALNANTAAIERLAKQPRTVIGIVLGDDQVWSTAFIATWTLLAFLFGAAFATPLADTFPSIGVPVANRLLDTDADFCRLVERRFAQTDCQVPRDRRIGSAGRGAVLPVTEKR